MKSDERLKRLDVGLGAVAPIFAFRKSNVASDVRIGESRGVRFLRLVAIFLSLSFLCTAGAASDCRMVLDVFPDRIEAKLLLPEAALEKALGYSMGEGAERNDARDALALYLQSHFTVASIEKQPMAVELDRVNRSSEGLVEAALLIYPPDDVAPVSFVISGDLLQEPGARRTLEVFLRRDAAELRFGLEPLISLGSLDYFHRSMTVEREPLSGIRRGAAACAAVFLLLLASGPVLVVIALLLLRATLAGQGGVSAAFVLSARAVAVFAAGCGLALLSGATAGAGWTGAGMALLLVFSAWTVWKPLGWRTDIGVALAAGWCAGVSWNGRVIAQGISGADMTTLFYLTGAGFLVLTALTLLVLPTFLVVARRVPSGWLKGGGAVCGVIVALQVLTGFALFR